ncbi:MAG TPA: cytochrome c3 family protein [Myxococcales bacterium]|jgi:predicted CXXCH cytochrome family protein
MTLRALPVLLAVSLFSLAAAPAPKGGAKSPPAKAEPAKAAAAPADASKPTGRLATAARALAPLPAGEKAAWSHAPFEEGNCGICHQKNDPKNPGPIVGGTNELCYGCHEEFQGLMQDRPHQHRAAKESCSNCHNAHNSREKKLLLAEPGALCLSCHEKVQKEIASGKVIHKAVDTGAKCSGCHNPHASNVEKLLVKLPFDLCVSCHSTDDLADTKGVKLTNFKKLLDENPSQHAPVAAKDCSACHQPHASENFRLLTLEYPAAFYAPFDPKNYELCFDCHNPEVVSTPTTTKLTRFRDGDRNLHYVHVHKEERGRTCRACHDVHASKQDHHIREAVPYGPKGWMLKVGYTQTPTGGSCSKTCHATKDYTNRKPGDPVPSKKK